VKKLFVLQGIPDGLERGLHPEQYSRVAGLRPGGLIPFVKDIRYIRAILNDGRATLLRRFQARRRSRGRPTYLPIFIGEWYDTPHPIERGMNSALHHQADLRGSVELRPINNPLRTLFPAMTYHNCRRSLGSK
jgi:hypothetical protein